MCADDALLEAPKRYCSQPHASMLAQRRPGCYALRPVSLGLLQLQPCDKYGNGVDGWLEVQPALSPPGDQ